jgi:ABC-type sugar transport system ATPase subunit
MFLGHELLRFGLLDEDRMENSARQTLGDLAVTTVQSVRQPVGSLSGGQRQAVAVARAVMRDARLVILDEPTAALGVSQTEQVLQLIRRLAERGIAVLVVSHNLTDVFAVADRIGVLRLGRLVSSGPIGHYDAQRTVELITTGRLSSDDAPAAVPTGASAGAAAGGAAPTGDDRRPPAGPDRSDPDAGGG